MNTIRIKILIKQGRGFVLASLAVLLGLLPIHAVSAIAYAVPHAVSSNQTLAAGTLVALDGDNAVRPARQDEGRYVAGCVASVPAGSLPAGMVGIASSGIVSVLVSTLGGDIAPGDPIALSPLEGVGMKAHSSGWIVGTAQASLTAASTAVTQQQLTASDGKVTTATIKAIPLLLSVSYYNATTTSSTLTSPVQNAVEAVAGHPVSTDRAFLALLIFGISVILLVTMVYSAVRNSLVSIGRNPLANSKISKSLTKVLITALIVITITLFVVYLILQ